MWFMGRAIVGSMLVTLLTLATVIFLWLSSPYGHLQPRKVELLFEKIAGGYSWNERGVQFSDDVRLVVFGDSWVDDPVAICKEEGKTWPQIFCDEINCTSRLTFAASQPVSEYLHSPPVGVRTSHSIHSVARNEVLLGPSIKGVLPDLGAQISTYLAVSPPGSTTSTTIFILSIGFWDIYSLANLNLNTSLPIVDQCIDEIFAQLGRIKSQLTKYTTYPGKSKNFRVILPKVLDPTLSPGWTRQNGVFHRLKSSQNSLIEQQKNTIYLTDRWNEALERRANTSVFTVSQEDRKKNPSHVGKDYIYVPDLPQTLIGLILEHYLKAEAFQEPYTFIPSESQFYNVNDPCLDFHRSAVPNDGQYNQKKAILSVCSFPYKMLWWDPWRVGAVGNRILAKEVSALVAVDH